MNGFFYIRIPSQNRGYELKKEPEPSFHPAFDSD